MTAADPIDGRAFIAGRTASVDGGVVQDISPVDGRVLAEVASCTGADVDRAVDVARRAYDDGAWSLADAGDRKAVLLRLAELIDQNAEELAQLETLDMGKPLLQSTTVDIAGAAEIYRWYAELTDKLTDEIPSTPGASVALVQREPLGVIAAVVPWNYPLEITTWKLAPALATGNSVVLKPATQSPLTALRLADLAVEAGIPEGVLSVVPGRGSTAGDALARHMGVDMLTFTGSTAVAKRLQIAAGESNLKRLALEAGGKSANLIFADTGDLREAARMAASGAFYNNGQVCSANSRILVERSVHDEFVDRLVEAAEEFRPGDPLDRANQGCGAVVDAGHADDVMAAVEEARTAGTLRAGGRRIEIRGSDCYIEPTIVTDLPLSHRLHREEIFGPLVTVTPFDTEDEAVREANATDYGLAASLWTSDVGRVHRVSRRLVAGTVSVNTVDALGPTTPFGGFGQSGFGKDLSAHAVENYTELKTTWIQYG